MDVVAKLKNMFSRKLRVRDVPITVEASGFSLSGRSVRWGDVVAVVAYKLDLGTADAVRIRLTLSSDESVELDEDQPGFSEFMASLELQFPSAQGWRAKVIHPPFARNETLLYGRT